MLETVDELEQTAARQARNLTPTQSYERAAVLGRRLFDQVNALHATQVAEAYAAYYAEQRDAGVQLDSRAFEPGYLEQIRVGYPFHPELIRLFAERLADIPEFQATRGALRLVARTMRAVWDRKQQLKGTLLLQPHHVDLTRSDLRDEIEPTGTNGVRARPGGRCHAVGRGHARQPSRGRLALARGH